MTHQALDASEAAALRHLRDTGYPVGHVFLLRDLPAEHRRPLIRLIGRGILSSGRDPETVRVTAEAYALLQEWIALESHFTQGGENASQ